MKKRNGFTLIELSIVLIVIGLLVAGIVGGQSLIRQAELRSIVAKANSIVTAISVFSLEYDSFPGDMDNATSYWTDANNGNGDRSIAGWPGDEDLYVWQHLTEAEIYPGTFTGTSFSTAFPRSKFDGGYYWFLYTTNIYGNNGNYLSLGAESAFGDHAWDGLISGRDAQAIDRKVDDGVADSGRIMTFNGFDAPALGSGCVTNVFNSDTGSDYILTNTDSDCVIIFAMGIR